MASLTASSSPRPKLRRWLDRGFYAGIAVILLVSFLFGLQIHRATWDLTHPVRFVFDVTNAYNKGRMASERGLLNVYDSAAASARIRYDGVADYNLDYPPLRLTVAWAWYEWTRREFPDATQWQNSYEFNWPLLMMNNAFLFIAAVAAFYLVYQVRRWNWPTEMAAPPPHIGLIAASIAGILVWFSPPALLIGFGWPQWDIAVTASFLAALCLAARNWWLLAGAVLAAGAMFKGQTLVALPMFLIWPIVARDFAGLLRFLIGVATASAVIAAPFMFHDTTHAVRAAVIAMAAAAVVPFGLAWARTLWTSSWRWWLGPQLLAIAVCMIAGYVAAWYGGLLMGGAMAVVITRLFPRFAWPNRLSLLVFALAVSLWTCALANSASMNWLRIGILYGTEHYPRMVLGAARNFPAILAENYGIRRPEEIAFTLPSWLSFGAGGEISWRGFLRAIYVVGTILCSIAAGVHFRRRDGRFLLAAATPWLLFYTFPPQMHERYGLYPALASVVFLAVGFRWTLLHIALSLLAVMPVLEGMFNAGPASRFLAEQFGPAFGPTLQRTTRATYPGIGWAVVVFAIVTFLCCMDLRRGRRLAATPTDPESLSRSRHLSAGTSHTPRAHHSAAADA